MKRQLESHRKLEKDLVSQIKLCNKYKDLIENTLWNLQHQYKTGRIDKRTHDEQVRKFLQGRHPQDWHTMYDSHITKCHNSLAYTRQKIQELTTHLNEKRTALSKLSIVFSAIFFVLGIVAFLQPNITGLFGFEDGAKQVVSEDGYTVEGTRWLDINGARSYERCLKVTATNDFDAVRIIAKITRTGESKDLMLGLYAHNEQDDEPDALLDACTVTEYEDVWKSCTITTTQQKTDYWICAASPSGQAEEVLYTIAYQVGDKKRTALWTGENWQKLDRSSYTIRAQFMKNEN